MMIAPERIEADLAQSRGGGAFAGDAPAVGDLFVRLAMTWDAANAVWNEWVLAYGPDSQAALLAATGIERPSTRHLIIALLVTAMSFLAVLAFLFSRGDRPPRDRVSRAWEDLCRRLALAARARDPAEGPDEYARAVAALRPDLSEEVRSLTGLYTALRYDGDAGGPLADRFISAVRAFRPQPLFRR
jgi:hypothetical protein